MTYRLYRRAAMTAACFSLLVVADGAEAQTRQSRDCRYEPNFAVAAPDQVDRHGCRRMRRGAGEIGVTGAIGRVVDPVAPRASVGRGNRAGSVPERTGAAGVTPTTQGSISPNGSAATGTNQTDNPANVVAPKGTNPSDGSGNASTRNNNGLGNGYDPKDTGFVAGDPNTDLAKGVDPSNPGGGIGAGGKRGGKGGKS
jgi:hypothetical protein